MTSTASPPNQNPAPTPAAPAGAPSYASAAGANKKPTSSPLIATGSQPPVVVGSSSAQNGKPSTAAPLNGRPNFTPAVPVATPPISRGSAIVNGGPDHARKSSVTISANAPAGHIANGGHVGAHKNIQFGFNESPAVAHSTPQMGGAAPIPIPGGGNPRIQSPAHSPSPIPQMPQQSGGGQRAPNMTQAPLTFGSFPGDNDRHMKQHNPVAMGQSPHVRRDSQASTHGEGVGHGGPAHGRGGYQGQGRGRGGFNQQYNNANMGYPPNRNFSGPNAGRGGMPPYHQGRGGMQQFPNSPQPHRASPATTPAMPHVTPTMQPAALAAGGAQPYYHHAMNPAIPPYPHQVKSLPINNEFPTFKSQKKNKAGRRDSEKGHHLRGPSAGHKQTGMELVVHKPRPPGKRWDSAAEGHQNVNGAAPSPEYSDVPPPHYHFQPGRPVPMFAPQFMGPIDLSPESGTFEKLLTANKLQMGAPYGMPPPLDSYRMNYQYPPQQMNHYMPQPTQFPPPHQGFVPAYAPGQPGAQPMSRNASQVSDRPASSTGQNQAPAIAQGTPQQRPAQVAPAIVSSPAFTRPPKKSAAIVIKNSDGQVVDLTAALKPPASPVPSIQQSKTPPAIVSTPTPPPKPSTPSHGRTDSTSTGKTAEQVRNEFMNLVRKQADAPSESKAKEEEEEAAVKAAEEKAAAEKAAADKAAEEQAAAEKAAAEKAAAEQAAAEKAAAEKAVADKAAADKAAAEKAAAEEKAKEEARLEAEKKAAEEAKAKEQAEAEAKAKAETEAAAAAAKQQPKEEKKSADEMSDEDIERMIREMEEEDARREKEQEDISAKKKAQREEEKKRAEASKLSSTDNDKKLKEQEAEMERIEEERERRRAENEAKGVQSESLADLLAKDKKDLAEKPSAAADASTAAKAGAADKAKSKPAALNLAPLKTTPVEAPQPSAALQSLRSARFLPGVEFNIYPAGIASPNPALNAAVQKKGKIFKYDAQFLLQFQQVFTEQPSLEFHQQVKSLIGDSDGSRSASARTPGAGGSSRQASRAGSSTAFPPGGAFGQFGSKPLPPGTTSEQRFAMSQGSGSGPAPRPSMGAPGPFNRTGVFPGQMSRTPSSGPGGLPSPRTGSRRGGGSRKDYGNPKADAQAAKTMPLTAGMELKPIAVTATGWKPSSIGSKAGPTPTGGVAQGAHLEPEIVQRKVKAALNKMTPENFDKISEQILVIAGQSKNEQDGRTLRQVIQLTFEKATDEAHWASMYAKFAKRMLETMSPEIRDENIIDKAGNVVSGGALFRKYLLNRCQEEFERGWKVDLPQPKEGEDKKAAEAALLSDEYYVAAAAKRRGLGLVQFIGELYKLNMLTERIMHECVRKLLEFNGIPDEAEIESLTKLLKTIGGNLESTEKGRAFMEAYFQRIDTIVHLDNLPSRLMFMLMDIIDLRRSGWVSKEANKGPKTLDEVRAEAEAAAAQKALESARSNQRGPPGGRPMGGRGESRNFSYNNPPSNQVGMDDLKRLKGSSSRTSSQNPSFGPTSMFNSRSNSGRRMGGPGGAFGRAGEDSGASSRTGTPPVAHANAFGLLADTGDHPGSPPSTHASPALSKATLNTVAAGAKKED